MKPVSAKKKKGLGKTVALVFLLVLLVGIVAAVLFSKKTDPLKSYYQEKFDYVFITDTRDGQVYRTLKLGDQIWMAQNLNYATRESVCDSCEVYGRLYSYGEAINACPAGFSLPTLVDFKELRRLNKMAQPYLAVKGWNGVDGDLDEFGFAALPGGFYNKGKSVVEGRGKNAGFWLTEKEERGAIRMFLKGSENSFGTDIFDWNNGLSVRCVRFVKKTRTSNRGIFKALSAQTKSTAEMAHELLENSTSENLEKLKNVGTLDDSSKFEARKGKVSEGFGNEIYEKAKLDSGAARLFAAGRMELLSKANVAKLDIDLEGTRGKEDIQNVVERRIQGLRHVYAIALKRGEKFSGKMTLKFTVTSSGEVTDVAIVSSTTANAEFDNKIKNMVAKWKFDATSEGNTTVTIPLNFAE